MSIKRELTRIYTPEGKPGFLGNGHIAREVVQGGYQDTDPFILLMDDMLDKKDEQPAGGPHPHAGFETVSLLLEGRMGDAAHQMHDGDLQIMTAGSGVVHTETITKNAKLRLLQLWLILPKKERRAVPRVQDLSFEHAPKTAVNGANITVYSGSLAGVTSPVKNYVPVIIADIRIEPGKSISLNIPASYNTFLYVIEGSLRIGETAKTLKQDQTGWLNRSDEQGDSELIIKNSENASRVILYSGQPQGEPIVSHGPFIGDSTEDIHRLYAEYRSGRMKHISTAPPEQRLTW